jgi:adenylylsulfate kinase-like enzyme
MSSAGVVVWVTGLSGSGKSTFAKALGEALHSKGVTPISLDGDELRVLLGVTTTGYSRDDRLSLAFRYAELCQYLALQGHIVVIATMALFNEIHAWNRSSLPNYLEVLMDYPMTQLVARDPKGLYKRHSQGEVSSVAGLDFNVDLPESPHLRVNGDLDGLPTVVQSLAHKVLELRNAL